MSRFAAALFDLDGTLVDTEVLWVEAIDRVLRDRQAGLSSDDVSAIVYGRSWADIFADIQRLCPGMYPTRQSMEVVTVPIFDELCGSRDIRVPGSADVLRTLAAGMPVSIVSGSTRGQIQSMARLLGIEDVISDIVGCEDYHPGKPDPVCFRFGAERLGVDPAACIVFEDSTFGVQAAKAAGMTCVALQREGLPRQDVSPADVVVSDLRDLDVDSLNP